LIRPRRKQTRPGAHSGGSKSGATRAHGASPSRRASR
jgi:hypothetical protein